jgi:hypothetical protein
MAGRWELSEEQWLLVEPVLRPAPRAVNRCRPWHDTRAVLNGVLWVLGTGPQWRELPEKYPPFQTCHRRFQQWIRTGKGSVAKSKLGGGRPGPRPAPGHYAGWIWGLWNNWTESPVSESEAWRKPGFDRRLLPRGIVNLTGEAGIGSVAKFWRPLENGTNASGASHVRFQVASF